jgi:hypothetical protein
MESTIVRVAGGNHPGRGATEGTPDEDGIDLTLIRWMLSLTPDERWDALDRFASEVLELRDAESSL